MHASKLGALVSSMGPVAIEIGSAAAFPEGVVGCYVVDVIGIGAGRGERKFVSFEFCCCLCGFARDCVLAWFAGCEGVVIEDGGYFAAVTGDVVGIRYRGGDDARTSITDARAGVLFYVGRKGLVD